MCRMWNRLQKPRELNNRELLVLILTEIRAMAVDVTNLNAAIAANTAASARNTAAVDALLAAHADPAGQAAVDAATAALGPNTDAVNVEAAKAEAAVAPPAPAPAP